MTYYARSLTARDSSPVSFGNCWRPHAGKVDSAVALQRVATTALPGNLRLVVTGAYIAHAQHNYAETEKIARSLLNQCVPPTFTSMHSVVR